MSTDIQQSQYDEKDILIEELNTSTLDKLQEVEISLLLFPNPKAKHEQLVFHILQNEPGYLFQTNQFLRFVYSFPLIHAFEINLKDEIVQNICKFLSPTSISNLEQVSKSWYHSISSNDVIWFDQYLLLWPISCDSRRILLDLVEMSKSSSIGFEQGYDKQIPSRYNYKECFKYMNTIKEEISLSESLHEQMLSILALRHSLLLSPGISPLLLSYISDSVSWILQASDIVFQKLLTLKTSYEDSNLTTEIPSKVHQFIQSYHSYLEHQIIQFITDVSKTHVKFALESYLDDDSDENALETLLALSEAWRKIRIFLKVVASMVNVIDQNIFSIGFSSMPLHILDYKQIAEREIAQQIFEPLKQHSFDLIDKIDLLDPTFLPDVSILKTFFEVLKEPGMAALLPKLTQPMLEEQRLKRNLKHILVETADQVRLRIKADQIALFTKTESDFEACLASGSSWMIDDTYDQCISLESVNYRDLSTINQFCELEEEAKSLENDAKQAHFVKFVKQFVDDPNQFISIYHSVRNLGYTTMLQTFELVLTGNAQSEDGLDVESENR